MALSVTVTPGLIGGNIVWPVLVIIHILRLKFNVIRRRGSRRWRSLSDLEILSLLTAVARLARLGSWETNRAPTRVPGRPLPLTGETFHLLLPSQDDGADVPQLRQLLVERETQLVCGRSRVLTGPGGDEHFSPVDKPVTTLLELRWTTSLSQTPCPTLQILHYNYNFIIL